MLRMSNSLSYIPYFITENLIYQDVCDGVTDLLLTIEGAISILKHIHQSYDLIAISYTFTDVLQIN